MLIDSHCHLDFEDFGTEVPEVIARAHAAEVGGMITICTHASKFAQVAAVADKLLRRMCGVRSVFIRIMRAMPPSR